jgi:hypothetical protein
MIRNKAMEIYTGNPGINMECTDYLGKEFQASVGWLNRFLNREGLSLRRKTTQGQKIPDQYMAKLTQFILYTRSLRIKNDYGLGNIYAMDETPVWLDMPGASTIEEIGVKSVPIRTTGHEKARGTVCLTAKGDGTKMPPVIVFKGKRMPKELENMTGVICFMSDNGWMNEELTKMYLRKVVGSIAFSPRLLIWDSYRCHISEATKAECKRLKIDMSVIPGGCTGLVQVYF